MIWPRSATIATFSAPKVLHAAPPTKVPHAAEVQSSSDSSKRTRNWNCSTTACEYSRTEKHTSPDACTYVIGAPVDAPRS